MKKVWSLLIAFSLFLGMNQSVCVLGANVANTDVYDDFSQEDEVNMIKSNWSNGNEFDCVFSPDNVKFWEGNMYLTLNDNSTDENYKYAGAEYATRSTYGYGSYRVSMRPIKNDGVVSSFFLYTGPSNGTVWDEIDIEFLGKDTTIVQFNFFTNGVSSGGYLYSLGFDAAKGLHEYGFDWSKDAISWYVDGKKVYTVTAEEEKLPSTPGKIMMNVWNGKSSLTKDWLKEYDGTVPLSAKYDYISYIAEENKSVSISATGTVDVSDWTTDIEENQYLLETVYQILRVTRSTSQNQENAYFEGKLSETVENPTELSLWLKYINGYQLAATIYLIDEDGNVIEATRFILDREEKGEHSLVIPLENIEGKITSVRIALNSNPEQINVKSKSYCKIYLNQVTVTN
ncbi:MAG: glycoside hydrolase family 16 protein [Roseburia sp.]